MLAMFFFSYFAPVSWIAFSIPHASLSNALDVPLIAASDSVAITISEYAMTGSSMTY